MLRASTTPLVSAYDLAMLDLDGVVYISGQAIEGAPEAIATARASGIRVAFVTNNASRTPEKVAGNLVRLGVAAAPSDVVTSSQAAARILASRLPPESRVLTLGAEGLSRAVVEEALVPVTSPEEGEVGAVVTGYGPEVLWRDVMRAAVLIRDGLWWVATNTDLTIPTSFGMAPGHGVMVRMLEQFSGVHPEVAGKPQRPLLDEAIRRMGGRRALMVGDRLDTDIEGAHHAEVESLLVLTGVSGLPELLAAPPERRPTYLATGLAGLMQVHPAPTLDGESATCGGWQATGSGGVLSVSGTGSPDDWWRAVAATAWQHLDRTGKPLTADGLTPPGVTGPR